MNAIGSVPEQFGAPTGRAAVLCGLGGWLPPRAVTNEELAERLDTSDQWIRTRTGISRRYVVEPGQATSDLAVEAGRRALRSADMTSADTVLVTTSTPDRPIPATAPLVAARLGLHGAAAFDVAAVCSGFVYSLATAVGLIAAGVSDRILLIASEVYSSVVDPDDRTSAVIMADGAGAVMLRAGHREELGALGDFDLGSDGTGEGLIMVAAGGSRQRSSAQVPTRAEQHFAMRGREVYRHAVTRMTASAQTTLRSVGWKPDEVDCFVPHQANLRILHSVAERLGIDPDRCACHVVDVGNTGAASIPLALRHAAATGRLRSGNRVLLSAFGGGLAWGSCALYWPDIRLGGSDE